VYTLYMADTNRKKVLIIEDDNNIIQMYSMKFKEKYDVLTAKTGVEGLEVAKNEKPDIILLDVIIPQLDGFAVLAKLKEDASTKNVPVILLTNLGQESDRKKGIEKGAVEYLVKVEHTPSQVLETIGKYIK